MCVNLIVKSRAKLTSSRIYLANDDLGAITKSPYPVSMNTFNLISPDSLWRLRVSLPVGSATSCNHFNLILPVGSLFKVRHEYFMG